jgi:hypothetical protein
MYSPNENFDPRLKETVGQFGIPMEEETPAQRVPFTDEDQTIMNEAANIFFEGLKNLQIEGIEKNLPPEENILRQQELLQNFRNNVRILRRQARESKETPK